MYSNECYAVAFRFFMRFAFSKKLPHLLAAVVALAPAATTLAPVAATVAVAASNFPPIYSRIESLALVWYKKCSPPVCYCH